MVKVRLWGSLEAHTGGKREVEVQASTLRELLAAAGLDVDEAMARVASPELDARIERDTRDAIARGVFGAPSYVYGDEVFWGQDRLDFLDRALAES